LLTYIDWTRRFMIRRYWLTQTEHGGLWLDVVDLPRLNTTVYDWTFLTYPAVLLTYGCLWSYVDPSWTRRLVIGCWLTQREDGGLWLEVDVSCGSIPGTDIRIWQVKIQPTNIKNFINFPFRQICPLLTLSLACFSKSIPKSVPH
jgi:hypothetical protein